MLKKNDVSQRKAKTKYLEKINPDYLVLCCDRKEIKCKMYMGSTRFMMPLAEDTRHNSNEQRDGWNFAHFQNFTLLIVISSCSALNST